MFIFARQAIMSTVLLALLLCGFYPGCIYVAGAMIFPQQAQGSLLYEGPVAVGSALIGQRFAGPEYFHARPSAAGEHGYAAEASGASNYGPTSKALAARMQASAAHIRAEQAAHSDMPVPIIPVDLLTSSGSGLDPHISPAAALIQAPRVAKARNIPVVQVQALVRRHIQGPEWALWGEPRVNVLHLNMALRRL